LAVDDQSAFLAVMRELVDAADGLETVGEADSAERAIELAREIEPDLVLMDVWMAGTDGIAAARAIKARRPATVVVLTSTTHPDDLPLAGEDHVVDAVIWKGQLEPRLLEDIWCRSRDQGSSPSF
jgi:two-component system chemotaxis response regulator CheB/two-component system chemotaxis response regulator CheY